MKKLTNYFLKGLLIFVPTALTVFTVIWVFTKLDSLFGQIFKIEIPGLGLVITILVITLTGLLASNFLGNKFFALVDQTFTRLPLVKLLYSAIKDMIGAFTGEKKGFEKPVLVELIAGGPKAAGFITRESLEVLGLTDHVAVYLPQSYNFAGSVLIFPAEQVKPLNIESSEAMAFIVSGGVSGK
jgi:uncharacterized membrane protein